jgi:hypothetical protein
VRAVGPGKVLISESNAEAYLGSLHAYLALYGFRECNVVPAFQAVYGEGKTRFPGTMYPMQADAFANPGSGHPSENLKTNKPGVLSHRSQVAIR